MVGLTTLYAVTFLGLLTSILLILNQRLLKTHTSVSLMISAIGISIILLLIENLGVGGEWLNKETIESLITGIDFPNLLMNWILPLMLFAGALKFDIADLVKNGWAIGTLATVGVLVASLIVGVALWILSFILGLPVDFLYCVLFGALIVPTDPVAVSSVLRKVGVKKSLEAKIVGESLFNDGASVVLFLALLAATSEETSLSISGYILLPFVEIGGAAIIGLLLGIIANWLLRNTESLMTELIITVSLVWLGTSIANGLTAHFGLGPNMPLTVVVMGLFLSNHNRKHPLSWSMRTNLNKLWVLIDEILTTALFVFMGLMLVIVDFSSSLIIAGIVMSVVVLGARYISVKYTMAGLEKYNLHTLSEGSLPVLVWGGMRGAISFAMAMMLPAGPARDALIGITFIVVVISVIGQGLTMEKIINWSGVKNSE